MKTIKLTESAVKDIIKESALKILSELKGCEVSGGKPWKPESSTKDCKGWDEYVAAKKKEAEDEKKKSGFKSDEKNLGTKVHFNESQLREFIAEAVKRTLMEMDEINQTGRDYSRVKKAYEKMIDLGQYERARKLKAMFNDLSDDPNSDVVANYQFDDKDNLLLYNRDRTGSEPMPARRYNGQNGYEPITGYRGIDDVTLDNNRFENPKKVNDIVKHIKNVNPNTRFSKNDFRR